MISPDKLLGRHVIILGDVGKGKTKLLAELIENLIQKGYGKDITVIDLAPPRIGKIGGTIDEYLDVNRINYLKPKLVYAPRTQACNPDDVMKYVSHNLQQARNLFRKYLEAPTKILAVNDITIHLQGGEVEEILELIDKTETFVATAYKGDTLREDYGTGITKTEQQKLNQLTKYMDTVIQL